MTKNSLKFSFLTIIALSFILLSPLTTKAQENTERLMIGKSDLIKNKVNPQKVDSLLKKMYKGDILDSDKFLEEKSELQLASSENEHYRKDFPDGSFVESTIEDITDEVDDNLISPAGITQIGGLNELRTLRVSHTAPWGTQAFTVQIEFPMMGYAKIIRAYDWYYLGTVGGVDYRGIYRAKETSGRDAVAIQRLHVSLKGISFISKFDFRIRDKRYWTVYKS